ncbi:sensor histidine kinase [Spirosoma jeollabukense]
MSNSIHPSDSLLSVYRTAFEHSRQGFCLLQKLPTLTTALSDFRYLLTNPAFEQQMGLDQAVGKTIRQLVPQAEAQIMDYYDGVARTGQPIHFEDYVSALDIWMAVDAFRVGEFDQPTIGVLFTNITQRKLAEEALRKSEEKYRLLGIASSDVIYTMSPDWTQMHQLMGKSFLADTNDLNASWLEIYIPPEDQSQVWQVIQEAIRTKSPFELEHHVRRADGTIGWTFSRAIPVLDEQGVIQEWLGAASDITARRQALESQQQSKDRLQLALDVAQLGTWNWNLLTNEGYLDARGAELIGLAPGYLANVAQAQMASIHPDDLARTEASVMAGIANGVPFGLSYRVIHPDQRVHHIRSRFRVVADPTGRPVELMGTNLDITAEYEQTIALRQSEEQLRQLSANLESQVHQRTGELAAANHELMINNQALAEANDLLVRSNANLQTFAYIASHDLQEPLRKIQQFGDLLKTRYTDSTGEAFVYLERMQTAAARMSTLIRDLLNYSRISTQRDESAPVSLQTIVATVLTTLDWTIQQSGAQIQVGPLPTLTGDASQLGQLFQNLLSNALKFRQADTPPLIQVWAQPVKSVDLPAGVKPSRVAVEYHRIDVVDNGVGFEEKYLDRIFQVFQRLHGKNEFAGTGIGLAICEKVVTNHGGAITATSQLGQGATFSVYLPG